MFMIYILDVSVYSPKAGYLPQVLRTIPPLNDKKFIEQNFANCLVKPYALPPAYNNYDGFVVLHGTDTLAYTASALSFMMENLGKPVIITGSQIPVAEVRSDGMENLIGALVVAANLDIPEEAINRGCLVVNCSQCVKGQVDVNYATGKVQRRSAKA
ncbi:hypothetical protein OSTOST_06910 [Ostertagia ostertagi]